MVLVSYKITVEGKNDFFYVLRILSGFGFSNNLLIREKIGSDRIRIPSTGCSWHSAESPKLRSF
jgi:hypothetical protein